MNGKHEAKISLLFASYVEPLLQVKGITTRQKKAITSSVKSFARQFNKEVIDSDYGHDIPFYVHPDEILKQHAVNMCQLLGIEPNVLFLKTKGKHQISTSRQVMMYLLRTRLKRRNTHDEVLGQVFNRDRATVIHSIKTIKSNIQIKDPLTFEIMRILKDYDFNQNN